MTKKTSIKLFEESKKIALRSLPEKRKSPKRKKGNKIK